MTPDERQSIVSEAAALALRETAVIWDGPWDGPEHGFGRMLRERADFLDPPKLLEPEPRFVIDGGLLRDRGLDVIWQCCPDVDTLVLLNRLAKELDAAKGGTEK